MIPIDFRPRLLHMYIQRARYCSKLGPVPCTGLPMPPAGNVFNPALPQGFQGVQGVPTGGGAGGGAGAGAGGSLLGYNFASHLSSANSRMGWPNPIPGGGAPVQDHQQQQHQHQQPQQQQQSQVYQPPPAANFMGMGMPQVSYKWLAVCHPAGGVWGLCWHVFVCCAWSKGA